MKTVRRRSFTYKVFGTPSKRPIRYFLDPILKWTNPIFHNMDVFSLLATSAGSDLNPHCANSKKSKFSDVFHARTTDVRVKGMKAWVNHQKYEKNETDSFL